MTRLLKAVAVCVFTCGFITASAQTVTVKASHLGGPNPITGTISFQPVWSQWGSQGQPASALLSGGNGLTSKQALVTSVLNGAFSLSGLVDTSTSTPTNMCYAVTVRSTDGTQILGPGLDCIQPSMNNSWCSAGVCNFDVYPPNLAPLAIVQEGPQGPAGLTPTLAAGTVTSLPAGSTPTASISSNGGGSYLLNLGIPSGSGSGGSSVAPTLSAGTITSLSAGSTPTASITSTGTNSYAINLGIPTGPQGPTGAQGAQGVAGATGAQGAAGVAGATGPQGPTGATGANGSAGATPTLTIGTSTALAAGATPTVTLAAGGTANSYVLSFGIPAGAQGPQGIQGIQGPAGPSGSATLPTATASGQALVSTGAGQAYTAQTLTPSLIGADPAGAGPAAQAASAPLLKAVNFAYAFGDSFGAGTGGSVPQRDGGFGMSLRDTPAPSNNFAVYGYTMPQIVNVALDAYQSEAGAQLNPNLPNVSLSDGGINDTSADTCGRTAGTNCANNFMLAFRTLLRYVTIPDTNKIRASAATITGTNAVDTTIPLAPTVFASPGTAMSMSSSGATMTFNIPSSSSTSVGLIYPVTNTGTGSFTVSVDGTLQTDTCSSTTTFTSAPCGGQALASSTTYTAFTQEFAVSPNTAHTLVVTTLSASPVPVLEVDWVPPSTTPNLSRVFSLGVPPTGNAVNYPIYDTLVSSMVAQEAADGIPSYFVDVRNGTYAMNSTTDLALTATSTCTASQVSGHPNSCGYLKMYNQIALTEQQAGFVFSSFNRGGKAIGANGVQAMPTAISPAGFRADDSFLNLNASQQLGTTAVGIDFLPPYSRYDHSTATNNAFGAGFWKDASTGQPWSGLYTVNLFGYTGWVCASQKTVASVSLAPSNWTARWCADVVRGNTYQLGAVSAIGFTPIGITPTISALSTGVASYTITGFNMAGVLTVTTGATTASGNLATVNFYGGVATAPQGCSLTPRNAATAALATDIYVTAPTTTGWSVVVGASPPPANTPLSWSFACI